MRNVRWCDRELFAFPLYFCVCTTPAQFEHELKRLKLPVREWPPFLTSDHANAVVHYLQQPAAKDERGARRCALVCFPADHDRDPLEIVGLFAHEALHLVRRGMELIGEHTPSAEFEAYTLQGVLQELLQAYRRQGGFRPS